MNTDPSRPGETPAEPPSIDGAGLRLVEDRLRRSLEAEASAITPTDRLGAILDEGHAGTASRDTAASRSSGSGSRHHRWILPAAAAATAVLVTGTVWAVSRPPAQTPPVAATPTAVGTPTPRRVVRRHRRADGRASRRRRAARPSTPAPSATTGAQPPATAPVSVPVYYLGPVAAGSGQIRLFREFVSSDLPSPSVPSGNGGDRVAAGHGAGTGRQPLPLRLDRRHRRVGDGRGRRHHGAPLLGHAGRHAARRGAARVDRAGGARLVAARPLRARRRQHRRRARSRGVDVLHPAQRPDRGARPGRPDLGRRAGAWFGRQGRGPAHRLGRRQHLRGERPVAAAARGEGRRQRLHHRLRGAPAAVRTRSRRSSR